MAAFKLAEKGEYNAIILKWTGYFNDNPDGEAIIHLFKQNYKQKKHFRLKNIESIINDVQYVSIPLPKPPASPASQSGSGLPRSAHLASLRSGFYEDWVTINNQQSAYPPHMKTATYP